MCNEFVYIKKGKHWLLPQVKLLKDLPNCPKGRIFMQNMGGTWFNRMTDEEHIENKFQRYILDNKTILDNPAWFKKVKPAKI